MNEKSGFLNNIAGVILAGGASRRFGSNKAMAEYHGIPLIQHAARTLETIFKNRIIVTNDPASYSFLGWPTVPDIHKNAGPLAGIHTAMRSLPDQNFFITGCDMPLLNPNLIRYLCTRPGNWDVVIPWTDEGPEPLHALYSRSALPAIETAIQGGETKIVDILRNMRILKVSMIEILRVVPDFRSVTNINLPDDLLKLEEE